ncbi:MAG: hypothetical protein ACYTGX_17115 [Planctomycetota bacterium]|jgi:hypothetical protein
MVRFLVIIVFALFAGACPDAGAQERTALGAGELAEIEAAASEELESLRGGERHGPSAALDGNERREVEAAQAAAPELERLSGGFGETEYRIVIWLDWMVPLISLILLILLGLLGA